MVRPADLAHVPSKISTERDRIATSLLFHAHARDVVLAIIKTPLLEKKG